MIKFEYSCEDNIKNSTVDRICWDYGPNFENMNEEWRGVEIEYRYNSMGFRGAEPEQGRPCYISFGDSNTVGVGVHQHQAYPELIAKHFGIEHYSFAKQGTDAATVFRNVTLFFKNKMHGLDVKFITVLWPVWERVLFRNHEELQSLLRENYSNEEQKQFLDIWEKDYSLPYTVHFAHAVDLLCKIHKIPLVQMSWQYIPDSLNFEWPDSFFNPNDQNVYNKNEFPTMVHDKARDNTHPGPISHQLTADFYIKKLIELNS